MDKEEIKKQLIEKHTSFINYINALNEEDFLFSFHNEKWTAGQHLDHIYRSVKPLILAFTVPKWLLGLIFGKANRPSRSYEDLVSKYQKKLAEGGKAPVRFVPLPIKYTDKESLIHHLQDTVTRLAKLINDFSEESLEKSILPHPLLGKLTLREMLLFTIYHVQHHQKLMKDYLAQKK